MPEAGQMVSIQTLQLNINRNTVIINSFGQSVGLCRIQPGMWINAIFSSRMTRSIPPQSNAFMIVVRSRIQETSVTTDRIADVDACNGFIYTGNRGDINSQIRFSVPNPHADHRPRRETYQYPFSPSRPDGQDHPCQLYDGKYSPADDRV